MGAERAEFRLFSLENSHTSTDPSVMLRAVAASRHKLFPPPVGGRVRVGVERAEFRRFSLENSHTSTDPSVMLHIVAASRHKLFPPPVGGGSGWGPRGQNSGSLV